MKTLWVEGKANEWILVMRDGNMVKAGIGLKTFIGPFDQVARFPAKVHRVAFRTEQVTQEMQGVLVASTLVWTILRTGDGPFLAYKNLGADLNSSEPRTANEALVSMSSAIVRNCIANSTIKDMMTNRKGIQDMIQKEMFSVVKGWGVWLETFEVTEVKITSSSLFKDLQTSYREQVRKESELCKMKFSQEIAEVETKYATEKAEFKRGIDEQIRAIDLAYEQETKEAKEKFELEKTTFSNKIAELKMAHDITEAAAEQEFENKIREMNKSLEMKLKDINI